MPVSRPFMMTCVEALVRKGKTFKYETNVGAGLPLVDTLLQLHHSHDRITRIKGVFSGSMSFLFNTFSASDRNFTDVLNEASEQRIHRT